MIAITTSNSINVNARDNSTLRQALDMGRCFRTDGLVHFRHDGWDIRYRASAGGWQKNALPRKKSQQIWRVSPAKGHLDTLFETSAFDSLSSPKRGEGGGEEVFRVHGEKLV